MTDYETFLNSNFRKHRCLSASPNVKFEHNGYEFNPYQMYGFDEIKYIFFTKDADNLSNFIEYVFEKNEDGTYTSTKNWRRRGGVTIFKEDNEYGYQEIADYFEKAFHSDASTDNIRNWKW